MVEVVEVDFDQPCCYRLEGSLVGHDSGPISQVRGEGKDVEAVVCKRVKGIGPIRCYAEDYKLALLLLCLLFEGMHTLDI